MSEFSAEKLYDSVYVARQPVFTAKMEIWGYELLFRHAATAQGAVITDDAQATSQVIADGFALAAQGMRQGIRVLINFPRNILVSPIPYVLPPERCVIEILETVMPDQAVLEACRELKRNGYVLALDDFVGTPGFEGLCAIADIIKVDVLMKKPTEVMGLVQKLSKYKAKLLAEKVEYLEMYKVCKRLGFSYFQGYFFSKPEIMPGRKLALGETTKVRLLKELSAPDSDFSRLIEIVQTDLSISYRLLRYINSAYFGLRCQIESIQRAVAMLGRQNLQRWLQVIVLSDISITDKAQELVRISVQRGRFLQLLADSSVAVPFGQDSMFLLGFFSLLDAILDQYMDQILEGIPLDPQIRNALTKNESPHAQWITLLDELDRGDWARLEHMAQAMGLPMSIVDRAARDASAWTHEILTSTR